MHKYRKFKIILIFIIVGIFLNISKININANTNENINFKNISIRDGLSQSTAEVIFQDSRGYIWIGTADGLNRYDGYDFKIYNTFNVTKIITTITQNIPLFSCNVNSYNYNKKRNA